ncbi:MAG: nucleotidyltransferase domain-containing protein [Phycisphaeraceae bacterium]
MPAHIQIDKTKIAAFCRRNRIRKLSLFGSVLTDRFGPDSDVDVLVEFEPDARVGYFTIGRLINELTEMLGRRVDLRTPEELSRYFRQEVYAGAEALYAAA